jgi:hypothetical protein
VVPTLVWRWYTFIIVKLWSFFNIHKSIPSSHKCRNHSKAPQFNINKSIPSSYKCALMLDFGDLLLFRHLCEDGILL